MGKYKPNPQYDEEFSEAMRLKLRLNREARSKASAASPQPSAPSAASVSGMSLGSSFRDGVIDSILADHPKLTREELERMMEASGF